MLTGLEILVCSFTHRETRESFHGSDPYSKYRNERVHIIEKENILQGDFYVRKSS